MRIPARMLVAPLPYAAQFIGLLCLPTASVLPF
jgi:hypothetical protein